MPDDETWLGVPTRVAPLVWAGLVLGMGLGGFFDGIVFHQILQWHHMASAHPDPSIAGDVSLNVMLDGFFHALTYLLTVLGVGLLWRARDRRHDSGSGRTLLGSIVLGWGIFNLVEGVIDHQILGIHHVWPGGPGPVLLWDLLYLAWGALFVAGGYAIVQGAVSDDNPRGTE